ncbi:hypothetical protein LIER_31025 [Lithospermum erythrorhizon]|uniref:Uncharacterized protein n=1 Tax=Lithospermum erythrorhizon TaxID=34254 RepID=A0AAV3RTA3_LITER
MPIDLQYSNLIWSFAPETSPHQRRLRFQGLSPHKVISGSGLGSGPSPEEQRAGPLSRALKHNREVCGDVEGGFGGGWFWLEGVCFGGYGWWPNHNLLEVVDDRKRRRGGRCGWWYNNRVGGGNGQWWWKGWSKVVVWWWSRAKVMSLPHLEEMCGGDGLRKGGRGLWRWLRR